MHTANYPRIVSFILNKWSTAGQTEKWAAKHKEKKYTTRDAGQRCEDDKQKTKQKNKEVEMYSLGSSKALTQFLDQRLCLSFFSDVREELSENTQHKTSEQSTQNI